MADGKNKQVRNSVLSLLLMVFEKEKTLTEASQEVLMTTSFSEEDRRFFTRLSRGVLEREPELRAVLKKASSVPPGKMKPAIRFILCMGLYEIRYMDTKPYAVVSEAVKLTEKRKFYGLKGFVNGVLRTCQRDQDRLFSDLALNERLCMPEELYDLFSSWYDPETLEKICLSFLTEESGLTIRVLKNRTSEETLKESFKNEGISCSETVLDKTWHLTGIRDLTGLQSFQEGLFYIQDLSSQLDAYVLRDLTMSGKKLKVLDVCSAPGGKSIDVWDDASGAIEITACDVSEEKTALIEENIARLKADAIRTEVKDAAEFCEAFENAFDIVIADVPCSGLGTIRKRPDIRYHTTRQKLEELEKLQQKILDNVCRYVKPGGVLLYSTCTINPGENEKQTEAFLNSHPAFSLEDLSERLPEGLNSACIMGDIRMLPGLHPGDGFYVCRMRRNL